MPIYIDGAIIKWRAYFVMGLLLGKGVIFQIVCDFEIIIFIALTYVIFELGKYVFSRQCSERFEISF